MSKNLVSRKRPKGAGKQFGYNDNTPKVDRQKTEEAKAAAARGSFDFDTINGFSLKEVVFKMPPKPAREAMREAFKKEARPAFLKFLAENKADELRALGINDAGLELMKKGQSVNGFNVHHKLPIHGGGTNDFTNLIIMPIPPHDQLHHQVIDPQIKDGVGLKQGKVIKLPWTDDMVWKRPGRSRENTNVLPQGQAPAAKPAVLKAFSELRGR